jgi:ferredoxin-NADP reductase
MHLLRHNQLTLVDKTCVYDNVYEFGFEPDIPLQFNAGQYIDLVVPHSTPDSRGTTRSFSIISSPDERSISMIMRIPERASSFKRALAELAIGASVGMGDIGGEFVQDTGHTQQQLWIAGGIGVTPF